VTEQAATICRRSKTEGFKGLAMPLSNCPDAEVEQNYERYKSSHGGSNLQIINFEGKYKFAFFPRSTIPDEKLLVDEIVIRLLGRKEGATEKEVIDVRKRRNRSIKTGTIKTVLTSPRYFGFQRGEREEKGRGIVFFLIGPNGEEIPPLEDIEKIEAKIAGNPVLAKNGINRQSAESENHSPPNSEISIQDFLRIRDRKSQIGEAGERVAVRYEVQRLRSCGCPNPEQFVKLISIEDVGRGYDLESTYPDNERCIEVKTSTRGSDGFYLSLNERKVLAREGIRAWIYLVELSADGNGKVVKCLKDPMKELPEQAFQAIAWKVKVE
jgi:hypothetical protein